MAPHPHLTGQATQGPNFSTSNISPIHSSIHGLIHDTYGTEPGILRNEKMLPATLRLAPAPAGPHRSFISGNASESHAEPAAAVNNSSSSYTLRYCLANLTNNVHPTDFKLTSLANLTKVLSKAAF